ncbi:MAG: hypothetical protein WBG86_07755 [Polyangiales bacterium]
MKFPKLNRMMSGQADEERWDVWIAQARNFAKRENYPDAIARLRLVRSSVQRALDVQSDAAVQARLARRLSRVGETLEEIQGRADQWRSAIAARRQGTIDQAAEEMAWPLPLAPDQR